MWAEMLRRERQLEATRVEHAMMTQYLMSGLHHSIEFDKRYNAAKSSVKKILAEITQSAYSTSYKRAEINRRLREIEERDEQMRHLDKMDSPEFNLQSWLKDDDV